MSNSLERRVSTEISGPPAPLAREFAASLSLAANREGSDGSIGAELLPALLRHALMRRREILAAALQAAPREKILAVLASLDGMVTRAENDLGEAKFAVRRDIEDLVGLPLWALEAAAAAFRRGDVGQGKFRPTAGELRCDARQRVQAYAEELAKIERVLRARVEPPKREPDPERRKALAAMLRAAAIAMTPGTREVAPPPADKSMRPTREDLRERYPDLLAASKSHRPVYPATPPDYCGKPCTLGAEARRAIGLSPKIDLPTSGDAP